MACPSNRSVRDIVKTTDDQRNEDEARLDYIYCQESLFRPLISIVSEVVGCTLRYVD